jgi:hypothetical protein
MVRWYKINLNHPMFSYESFSRGQWVCEEVLSFNRSAIQHWFHMDNHMKVLHFSRCPRFRFHCSKGIEPVKKSPVGQPGGKGTRGLKLPKMGNAGQGVPRDLNILLDQASREPTYICNPIQLVESLSHSSYVPYSWGHILVQLPFVWSIYMYIAL